MPFKVIVCDANALPGVKGLNAIEVDILEYYRCSDILGEPSDDNRPTFVIIAGGDVKDHLRSILEDHDLEIAAKDVCYIGSNLQRAQAAISFGAEACLIVPFGTPQIETRGRSRSPPPNNPPAGRHKHRARSTYPDAVFFCYHKAMKLVIGIIGPPLAGKETCATVLEQLLREDGYSVSRHTFSDILSDTLALWGLPRTRDNLQRMAIVMNAESGFGDGSLPRAMRRRLTDDVADVTILDGVRWLADEKMIRGLNDEGIKTVMIYITADPKIRYARLIARNRGGEAETTWEKFMQQEQVRTEVDIPDIGSRAEIALGNDYKDLEPFKRDINRVYESLFDQAGR
jgi:uridine kinase